MAEDTRNFRRDTQLTVCCFSMSSSSPQLGAVAQPACLMRVGKSLSYVLRISDTLSAKSQENMLARL